MKAFATPSTPPRLHTHTHYTCCAVFPLPPPSLPPQVRDLMLRLDKSQNLDAYLAAVGLHTPGLLPPATAAAVGAATHTR